jgi:hypothetical protein
MATEMPLRQYEVTWQGTAGEQVRIVYAKNMEDAIFQVGAPYDAAVKHTNYTQEELTLKFMNGEKHDT